MDQIKNFAKAIVDGDYDDSATEIQVIGSARLPATPPYNLVWWNITDYPDPSDDPNVEIVRVTAQDGDTFNITRAQEGTAASDHNQAGKTYALLAGLTARTVTDMLGDVFGSGTAILARPAGGDVIELRQSSTKGILIEGAGTTIEDVDAVALGDPVGNNNSSFVNISDQTQRCSFIGMDIATDRSQSASVAVGILAGKLPIYDGSGTLLGYIPIYSTIT